MKVDAGDIFGGFFLGLEEKEKTHEANDRGVTAGRPESDQRVTKWHPFMTWKSERRKKRSGPMF